MPFNAKFFPSSFTCFDITAVFVSQKWPKPAKWLSKVKKIVVPEPPYFLVNSWPKPLEMAPSLRH